VNKVTVTAKTVDDAVLMALKQLSAAQDQVTVTILEEPSKGFFGLIGARPAKVEVEMKIDPLAEAQKFLEMILENMKISAKVVVTKKSDYHLFEIVGDDLGIIIGRRGQTLESLQFLVNTVGNRYSNAYLRIILDAENYREKRKQTLQQLAERLAEKAVKSGQPVKLEPMSAHERKIIHTHLQGKSLVSTYSEGTDPNRYIVIQAKK